MSSPGLVKPHKVREWDWCFWKGFNSFVVNLSLPVNRAVREKCRRTGQEEFTPPFGKSSSLHRVPVTAGKKKSHKPFWEKFNVGDAVRGLSATPVTWGGFQRCYSAHCFLLQWSAARSRDQAQRIISVSLKLTWEYGLSFLPSETHRPIKAKISHKSA